MHGRYVLSKTFTFEAAHRLVRGYRGKCAYLHGHTWHVKVFVQGTTLDDIGMVADLTALKPLRTIIEETMDHSVLVSVEDTDLIAWLKKHDQRYYLFDENPTSEYVAREIFKHARAIGLDPCAVEIGETCSSRVLYEYPSMTVSANNPADSTYP